MEQKQKERSVIYKANPQFVEMLKKTRQQCQNICSKHFYRPVRVETIQGQVYEGRIMNMDPYHLYLEVTPPASSRQFYSPYGGPFIPGIRPILRIHPLTSPLSCRLFSLICWRSACFKPVASCFIKEDGISHIPSVFSFFCTYLT